MCSLSSTVSSSASWIARRLSKGCGFPGARFAGDLRVGLFQKGILTTRLTGSYVIASTSNHRSCIRSFTRTSLSGSLIVIVTSPEWDEDREVVQHEIEFPCVRRRAWGEVHLAPESTSVPQCTLILRAQ